MSRSLVKNSIFNTLYQSLNVFFPLFSAAYVARVLTPAGIGTVATAQNYVQYFVIFASLGIPNYAVREIAKNRKNYIRLNQVFSELFIINIFSTTISLLVFVICLASVFSENEILYGVVGISIILNYINIDWYYQGIEEYGYIAIRSFIVKCLSFIALLLLVKNQNDYIVYAVINTLALGINYIMNIIHLKKYNIHIVLRNLKITKHIQPIVIIFSSVIFVKLYTLFDVTLLSIFSDTKAVAYYSNCDKIVRIIITLVTAVGGILLPRLSQYKIAGQLDECTFVVNRVAEILLYLFLPIGIALFILSDDVILFLYGNQYESSIITLRILSLLIYALGFSNLFGTQVLLTFGKEKQLMLCTLFSSIISIGLNLFLIPLWSQNGAAFTSVFVESLVTICTFYFANKIIHITINYKFICKCLCSTLLMIFVIILVDYLIDDYFLCLLLSACVGGSIYIFSSYFMRNPIIIFLINILRNR